MIAHETTGNSNVSVPKSSVRGRRPHSFLSFWSKAALTHRAELRRSDRRHRAVKQKLQLSGPLQRQVADSGTARKEMVQRVCCEMVGLNRLLILFSHVFCNFHLLLTK